VVALLAAGLPFVTTTPSNAAATTPCGNTVTALNAVSSDRFASGGKIRRFNATVDFPNRTGFYDQSGRVMVGKYPAGSMPTLLNMPVGERQTVRSQVTSQRPSAIAAINGDFFIYRTIRGQAVEFSRGPMIKDGVIVRSDKQALKVVGVDSTGKPFGGTIGVRGSIQIGTGPKTKLAGVNWHEVQGDGVTLYDGSYSRASGSPRPAGAAEWVLNGRNRIKELRTSSVNAGRRGLAVETGTRVLAFPTALASVGAAGVVGQRVRVRMSQVTSSGVTLRTAIGRGAALVKGGTAAPAGCAAYDHSAAARPRTVIGWTKAGDWRSLTVPGNNISGTSRTGGFGLANTAALAKKLGMRFAFELDGGASVTWHTRSAAGSWVRRDLFGVSGGTYERPVANGIAFLPPPAP
jgi:exopolysaccharide biosynthesis protein